jgi:hypothetical protein
MASPKVIWSTLAVFSDRDNVYTGRLKEIENVKCKIENAM